MLRLVKSKGVSGPRFKPDFCCKMSEVLPVFQPFSYLSSSQVASRTSDSSVPSGFTKVVLKLFDSDPITVTVPEEVSMNNPKFMETVAEKALQEYRQKSQ